MRPQFHTHIPQHVKLQVFLYFNLYVFGYQMGRQKILNRMVTKIPKFNLLLINFFINIILIYHYPQILCHIFSLLSKNKSRLIKSLMIMILSHNHVMRYKHIFNAFTSVALAMLWKSILQYYICLYTYPCTSVSEYRM
jgi:hypothetical protein